MPFDKQKNQRKGFCFITFEQESVVGDLLKTPKQTINGHQVCKYELYILYYIYRLGFHNCYTFKTFVDILGPVLIVNDMEALKL